MKERVMGPGPWEVPPPTTEQEAAILRKRLGQVREMYLSLFAEAMKTMGEMVYAADSTQRQRLADEFYRRWN